MDPIDQPVSLDTTTPDLVQPVSLDTEGTSKAPPNPDVAASRAYKAYVGVGPIAGKSFQDLHQEISTGNEDGVRRDVASKMDVQNQIQRQQLIRDMIAKKGAPLTQEEVNSVLDPQVPSNTPVDPTSVIEQGYGHAVVDTLDQASNGMGTTFLREAQATVPGLVNSARDNGKGWVAKRELALTLAQDLQNTIANQSWAGWGADTAKSWLTFGLYDEAKMRGLVDGMYVAGGGLGSNLQEQASQLFSKPFDEYKSQLLTTVNKLKQDNPQAALHFVSSLLGQSTTDRMLADVNTAINLTTIPGVAAVGKAVARGIGLTNATRTAVRDTIEASAASDASKTSVLAAAGDTGEAAVVQTTHNVVTDVQGISDLTRRSIEALQTGFRADQSLIRANPGTRGQEIVNRLEQSGNTAQASIMDAIASVAKVNRTPEITSSQDAIRLIKEDMKTNYTGMPNTLLDTVGPHYDAASNTYWFENVLAREDGTYFNSYEEARNTAKLRGLIVETPKAYTDSLESRMNLLKDELKYTPDNHADVSELNRYDQMTMELDRLQKEHADIVARGPEGYPIKQQGLGFYISEMKPFNETSSLVRDNISKTEHSQIQASWINGSLGWVRTPEETLSKLENEQRKIATHGPSVLLGAFKDASKDIERVPRKNWDEFARAIDASRKDVDPNTGKKGWFQQSPGDLEDFYQRSFRRLPEESEIMAYFAFKRNVEAERSLRSLRSYSLKARIGVEQHRIYNLDASGERVMSPFFEGVVRKTMPGGDDAILVPGTKAGGEKIYAANDPRFLKLRKTLDARVKEGSLQVIEIHDPERRPLQNYGEKIGTSRIRYIITNNIETKPISLENQVARTGGGHFVYDYENYLKQAKVHWDPATQKHWYEGDTTVMPTPNTAVGKDIAKHMNEVRLRLKAGDEAAAQAYHTEHLPMSWDEHKGWYNESRDILGNKVPPRLSLHEPIHIVPRNKIIHDLSKSALEDRYPKTFKDGTREGSLARQSVVEFTGERDAYEVHTINDVGSRGNPLYAYEPAAMQDPLPTYNRALNRIINSSFLDDMKITSVEHWIEQAKDLLDHDVADLRHAPFYYFNNLKWLKAADPIMKSNLLSAKQKIDQFIGVPSKVDTFLHATANKLAESVYGKLGPKAAVVPNAMLPFVRNPLQFVRAVVFHEKMGLFAIPQFFTQLTTAANILAITGPRNVSTTLVASLLHQWSRLNASPEILAHLDTLATKMRLPGMASWRPGEWTEARSLMVKHLGFNNIGGEHALLDTPFSAKVVSNGWNKILDWGETPFREGAGYTRISAFYAAYKEFRDGTSAGGKTFLGNVVERRTGDATRAITREDLSAILARAADLDHNMSRASNSLLHSGGLPSIPGQFLAYSIRLSELMTGKRLTWQEKTRLFGVSSLLYGVPIGGLGLLGYPIGDYLRQKAKDQGYTVGDNYITSTVMEGLPAAIIATITGKGDPQAGNWYNVSKFGSKGLDPLQEFIDSDKTIWDIVGGASYSTLANTWAQTSGLRNVAMNIIRGDQAQYNLTAEDFTAPLREIASYNDAWRIMAAVNTGKWFSKNETYLSDTSTANALFMGLTGLSDTKISDIATTTKAIKYQDDMNKYVLGKFIKEFHRALDAMESNNPQQAEVFFKNAKAWFVIGDYPIEKRGSAIAIASQNKESLIDRLDWDYFMKDLPPSKTEGRMKGLQTEQNIKQKRAQN